jgi:hypothetical protein
MKIAVFWDFAPCSLVDTDVSEVLTDSIIKAIALQTARRNIPKDSLRKVYYDHLTIRVIDISQQCIGIY